MLLKFFTSSLSILVAWTTVYFNREGLDPLQVGDHMDFYLIDPSGSQLHLPVNPAEVAVEGAKKIETVNIINIGDVDFPAGDERSGISFSSFFPAEYDPSYCRYADIPSPEDALKMLINWKIAGKPIRLLITNTFINVLVLIAKISYKHVGGEPGDIYYDLSLRQWREVKVRTAAEAAAPAALSGVAVQPRPDLKPVPAVYVVKPGDSLWAIAKLQYGNGSRWSDIYEANKDTIGPAPDLIQPGMRLVMPA